MDTNLLIEQLKAEDETERMYAAEDLGFENASQGVEPLFTRISVEPSAVVREAIVTSLERITDERVIARAIDHLGSDDAYVRNAMTVLLARRGEAAHGLLANAFASADEDVRKFIIDTLAAADGVIVENIFRSALKDGDVNVVIAAVEHIGQHRKITLKPEVDALVATASEPMLILALFESLASIGDEDSFREVRQRFPSLDTLSLFYFAPMVRLVGAFGRAEEMSELEQMRENADTDDLEIIDAALRHAEERGVVTGAVQKV